MNTAPAPRSLRRARGEALRFAGLALAISSGMTLLKIGVGLYSGSHAVLASTLYSINDVLSAIAVVVSLRFGARRPTERHPYGFGNAEFVAVGVVSLAIAIGVVCMFVFSMADLVKGVEGPPHYVAITLSATSMVVCYILAKHEHKLAVTLDSPVLATGAEHHFADSFGCLAAMVGVAGAMAGYHSLDRVAAIVETLHLVILSGELLGRATRGLMDAAIPEEDTDLVIAACLKVEGVERVAQVRSRRSGTTTWVDLALGTSPNVSLEATGRMRGMVETAVHNVLGHTTKTQVKFQPRGMTSKLHPVRTGPS